MSSTETLSRWQATALAISFVVGSGILVLPVLSLEAAGAVASLHAWLLMSLIGLTLVLIFHKMSSAKGFTITGCFTEAFGPSAISAAKITILAALTFGMPVMIYTTASILIHLFHIKALSAGILSHGILTALSLNQLRPLRQSSKISLYSAALLLLLILTAVLFHLSDLKTGFQLAADTAPRLNPDFFKACTLTFFGYVGWESLSFFGDQLRDPKRDLKWIYGASFALISVAYLALSAVMTGAAARGEHFGIEEGFLSLLPDGPLRIASSLIMVLLLLANLNAWIFGGIKQTQELTGQNRRHLALLSYYLAVSSMILLLETKIIDLAKLFLLSNQNWIVIYGGILAFYFKTFKSPSQRLLGVAGAVGFLLLLAGCSKLILVNVALFVFFRFRLWQSGTIIPRHFHLRWLRLHSFHLKERHLP